MAGFVNDVENVFDGSFFFEFDGLSYLYHRFQFAAFLSVAKPSCWAICPAHMIAGLDQNSGRVFLESEGVAAPHASRDYLFFSLSEEK